MKKACFTQKTSLHENQSMQHARTHNLGKQFNRLNLNLFLLKSSKLILWAMLAMVWSTLSAQTKPDDGASVIHLTVVPNKTVKMTIIDNPGRVFWVETSPDDITKYTVGDNPVGVNLMSKNDTIKIHGEIIEFLCSQNGKNLTGLHAKDHKALKSLACNNNSIDTINLTNITTLESLRIQRNTLKYIDTSTLTSLKSLICNNNTLLSLDLTQNTNLVELLCWENGLTSLDVTKNTLLYRLNFYSNKISSIDLTQNIQLKYLGANENNLTSIDLSKNSELLELNIYNNTLSSIDLTNNTHLTHLNILNNKLSSLDLSKNMDLRVLHCSQNSIDTLDLSHNAKIYELGSIGNGLKSLIISPLNELMNVFIRNNSLSTENFDEIFCRLPERSGNTEGRIMVAESKMDPQYNAVLASTAGNAVSKNWKVVLSDNANVHTTGNFNCSTSLPEAFAETEASIYPNPAMHAFFINTTEPLTHITIYDFSGRELMQLPPDQRSINCHDWKPGIYLIRLMSANSSKTMKLVKR